MAWDLGAGEAAVLTWAIARRGTIAIVDDLAGRKCARAHGIPLTGTLGLVLSARKSGKIEAPGQPFGNSEPRECISRTHCSPKPLPRLAK